MSFWNKLIKYWTQPKKYEIKAALTIGNREIIIKKQVISHSKWRVRQDLKKQLREEIKVQIKSISNRGKVQPIKSFK